MAICGTGCESSPMTGCVFSALQFLHYQRVDKLGDYLPYIQTPLVKFMKISLLVQKLIKSKTTFFIQTIFKDCSLFNIRLLVVTNQQGDTNIMILWDMKSHTLAKAYHVT
jgi:hypothetical protein